jgi:Pyridoxamine 5'-phosphate oxidase
MRWAQFKQVSGDLGAVTLERMGSTHLCLVATCRHDGWPRISPVEPYFVSGELMVGFMAKSHKLADVRRDPRIAIHSIVTRWEADEGDVKLYGMVVPLADEPRRRMFQRAVERAHGWNPDPEPYSAEYGIFAIDIRIAGYARFTKGFYETWAWRSGEQGLRRQKHANLTP